MREIAAAEFDRKLVELLLSSSPVRSYSTAAVQLAKEFILTYGTENQPTYLYDDGAHDRFLRALRQRGSTEAFPQRAIELVKHSYKNPEGLTNSRQCVWWSIIEFLDLEPSYFTFHPIPAGTLMQGTKRGNLAFGGKVNFVLGIIDGTNLPEPDI